MSIATDWPQQLTPWITDELADYVAAIASMWQQVELFDDDPANDIVGWQALFDVDVAPMLALPWLAQCVGERLPVGVDTNGARQWIRDSPNWMRGTPQGIVNAVKRLLTGTQTVQFRERSHLDGTYDAECIAILTYASETPDEEAVRQALRRNVPADLLWEYNVVELATWAVVEGGMADWTQLETTYGPTWGNVAGAQPGYDVWS